MKFKTFSDLFKSPLPVVNRDGEIEDLEFDTSVEPQLLIVDEGTPQVKDIPVARVKCPDGGGATLRFDSWPPRYNNLNVVGYGHIASKENFVRRVNALLAAA